ncbi:SusC/RagA family TonB-linked outer membrane protein [Chitinophaga defluvii]|uniref:TonB-dependent receptor n=1 Tax=Chitinophaga defluvii TaxID=3163343 RepID=A0ABV2TEH6_9BACT
MQKTRLFATGKVWPLHAFLSANSRFIMRVSASFLVFILTALLLKAETGGAQNMYEKKVTLECHSEPLKSALAKLERASSFKVAYVIDEVEKYNNVTLEKGTRTVSNTLDLLLQHTALVAKQVGQTIVLFHKDAQELSLLELNRLDAGSDQAAGVITGIVTDNTGIPLEGASVAITGSAIATKTNAKGAFRLENLAAGVYSLVVTHLGYKAAGQQVTVDNNRPSHLIISLEPSVSNLHDVVVMGYGSQRKKDVTGAVSVVTSKDLENRPGTNFGYSLEGKAAGVEVVRLSGKPQAGVSIHIRGTTSITADSEPLYVVDGVPSATTFDLNPNDIETITILKDASSAAIYGASGANGVVLITTKKGKKHEPQISLNIYGGMSRVANKLDVLNRSQYIELMTELGQVADWSKYTENTDWHREVFRTAYAQNYQLSMSGGNEGTTYYLSGGWMKQDGVVRTNSVNRYNLKVNLEQKVNNFLKVGTNLSYSRWFDRNIDDNRGSGHGGVIMSVLTTPPIIGIYNPDGTFTANPLRMSFNNPVAYTDGATNGYTNSRFFGNVYGIANITSALYFKSMFGFDFSNSKYNYFLDPFKTDWGRVNKGLADLNINDHEYWLSENTLNYATAFGKHHLDALAGVSFSKTKAEASAIETKNFSGISVPTVNGGSVINSATGSRSARANQAFISRINYAYADKYLLTANFRADASSVFGPDNRWGYFPSFSAGWRISQENFLKDVAAINDLKLRFGWGKVGNDHIPEYSWYGQVSTGFNYVQGGVVQSGTAPATPENARLRWESTTQQNIGIDLAVLQSRLNFSVDAYKKETRDLLFDKPVATSTGFASALQNIGSLENKGVELTLSSKNLVHAFKWNTNVNFSINRNKVISIGEQTLMVGSIPQREETSIIKEGYPLGTFWGYIATGVDPKTGMMTYKDLDGNGEIDNSDKTVIGNANPKFSYGITNEVNWKGWSLSLFVQGVQGNDIFNGTRVETEGMIDYRNQSTAVLRRWKTSGQITDIPKATADDVTNSFISTRFVEKGSYLRVKSLSLSYNLPASLLQRARLKKVNLYITAENLYTFKKYSGYDPEVSAYGGQNGAMGIDYDTYPQVREFIFGLNISL